MDTFQLKLKYIQIISTINFYQSWQVYIIFINVMIIKLITFNKLILNIKIINI
jgi:hypothetical protein